MRRNSKSTAEIQAISDKKDELYRLPTSAGTNIIAKTNWTGDFNWATFCTEEDLKTGQYSFSTDKMTIMQTAVKGGNAYCTSITFQPEIGKNRVKWQKVFDLLRKNWNEKKYITDEKGLITVIVTNEELINAGVYTTKRAMLGKPVYEKDKDGNIVKDKDGNPVKIKYIGGANALADKVGDTKLKAQMFLAKENSKEQIAFFDARNPRLCTDAHWNSETGMMFEINPNFKKEWIGTYFVPTYNYSFELTGFSYILYGYIQENGYRRISSVKKADKKMKLKLETIKDNYFANICERHIKARVYEVIVNAVKSINEVHQNNVGNDGFKIVIKGVKSGSKEKPATDAMKDGYLEVSFSPKMIRAFPTKGSKQNKTIEELKPQEPATGNEMEYLKNSEMMKKHYRKKS